jgi:glutamine cyclotransferase
MTWRSRIVLVYDKKNLALKRTIKYPYEGWGITFDGKRFIASDGTSFLRFFDPETFEEIKKIEVFEKENPISHLNELEYIHGKIYANVWRTSKIAKISPETGQVSGWIELKGIDQTEGPIRPAGDLNGIAYDSEMDRLFVTGKRWPKIYEIQEIP